MRNTTPAPTPKAGCFSPAERNCVTHSLKKQSLMAPEEMLRGALVHVSFFFSECGRSSKCHWPILGLWPHAVSPDGPCTLPSAGSSARGPSDAAEPEGVHSWPWQWGSPSTLHVGEDLTEGEKEASHDQKSVCVCVCARTHARVHRRPCTHLSRCNCVSVKQCAEWMEQRLASDSLGLHPGSAPYLVLILQRVS